MRISTHDCPTHWIIGKPIFPRCTDPCTDQKWNHRAPPPDPALSGRGSTVRTDARGTPLSSRAWPASFHHFFGSIKKRPKRFSVSGITLYWDIFSYSEWNSLFIIREINIKKPRGRISIPMRALRGPIHKAFYLSLCVSCSSPKIKSSISGRSGCWGILRFLMCLCTSFLYSLCSLYHLMQKKQIKFL